MVLHAQINKLVRAAQSLRPFRPGQNRKSEWEVEVLLSAGVRCDFKANYSSRRGKARVKHKESFGQFALDRIELTLKILAQSSLHNYRPIQER